ncbi:MAG: hypothetical protein K0R00_917 [Herbinix sp.]|nr:hypothetical protein [Herbinix sp.]
MSSQVVGIDWSSGTDLTGVTSICTRCRKVISTDLHSDPDKAIVTIHKKCPHCGVEFQKHKIC